MAMNRLEDEAKKKAIAPDPISAAAGGAPAANAMKAALVNQASARPAWAASAANPAPAPQGQQAYQMFAPSTASTNQQLQMQRQEMGTNQSTSLTQMASQLDPSIRKDAERARQWRIMTPQQRREEVDRLAIEQDARTAGAMAATTPEDIQSYSRTLADASGTFIDSFGRSSPMYSPETQIRIRGYQREIEKEAADMLSGYDKTKWRSEKDMYDAIAALPSTQKAGEFGKAIAFNIVRKYSTPQMKAQMEAEDRNQKAFEQTFTAKAAEEIVQRMAQEGQVDPAYAQGYKFTNEGSKEFATQIWLNRDKDPRAGQIVNEIMANAPVMWAEINGRVEQDPAHQARREEMANQRAAQAKADAEKQKQERAEGATAAELEKKKRVSQRVIDATAEYDPERAKELYVDLDTGELVDKRTMLARPEIQVRPTVKSREIRTRQQHANEVKSLQSAIQLIESSGYEFKNIGEIEKYEEGLKDYYSEENFEELHPGEEQKTEEEISDYIQQLKEGFQTIRSNGGIEGTKAYLRRLESVVWEDEE